MHNNIIKKIEAIEIKDSRGKPAIEVTVFAGDESGSFAVPSGASTGTHEAKVLPVTQAIRNTKEIIAPALIGKNIEDQKEIDRIMIELDGTENKSKLGGNAMIGVSIACAKAAAKVKGMEVFEYLRTLYQIKSSRKIPYLYMNLINGGKHAKNKLAFQEYLIVPMIEDASEAVQIGIRIQNTLKEILLREQGGESLNLGDEGGYAPKLSDIKKPLEFLQEAIKKNNLSDKVRLALDVAASSFYSNGLYEINGKKISKNELMEIYDSLIKEFDLFSIEDPFQEEDFESFKKLKEKYPDLLVVGDDLTVTNKERLKEALEKSSINAMIIKPNQIGTLSETLETMKLAQNSGIELIVSHRSGETNDDFIADLAYAFGAFGLKSGSPIKPERMVKYQRLIQISK